MEWKFDENKLNQTQKDGTLFATGLRSIVGLSWNDNDDNLYAVNHGRDYLHNHAPNYFSKWEVFADGLTGTDVVKIMSDAKYRPMGLAEGPDGSLYISESKKGKIWRILYHGDRLTFGEKELQEMEKRKSRSHIKKPIEFADILP